MKWDEFAFANQQLAALLESGVPLETALQQSCSLMERGVMRTEFEKLNADLAAGIPLKDAIAKRKFPPFYIHMIQIGAKSGDLGGVLQRVSDYYQETNSVLARLKGLMVYPLILTAISFLLSLIVAISIPTADHWRRIWAEMLAGERLPTLTMFSLRFAPMFLWGPTVVLALMLVALLVVKFHSGLRRWLRWRVPALQDVSLWQFASSMQVMLNAGCRLDEALAVLARIEERTPAEVEIREWRRQLSEGSSGMNQVAVPSRSFPGLFLWLVALDNEDIITGFQEAAEVYHGRATFRVDLFLYALLPVSILFFGVLIMGQFYSLAHMALGQFMPLIY